MISYTGFTADEMDRLEEALVSGWYSYEYWFSDGMYWYNYKTAEIVEIEELKLERQDKTGYWLQSSSRVYFVPSAGVDISILERIIYNITGEQHD